MKRIIYGSVAFAPVFAFAAQADISSIGNLIAQFKTILDKVIPIIFAIAIIYFFWGLAKFIRSAGDPKAQGEGKSIMIYGIIALAVMVSVYGLINFLQTSTGITSGTVTLPTVPNQ